MKYLDFMQMSNIRFKLNLWQNLKTAFFSTRDLIPFIREQNKLKSI